MKREIVRVVKRKLCDIALDSVPEQKSTAESSDKEETYEQLHPVVTEPVSTIPIALASGGQVVDAPASCRGIFNSSSCRANSRALFRHFVFFFKVGTFTRAPCQRTLIVALT